MEIASVVGDVFRAEWGRILATLIRLVRDFDLAEEVAQEAFAAALERWGGEGVPANPRAWIVSTARHKAIDRLRRRASFEEKRGELEVIAAIESEIDEEPSGSVLVDDRLRLVFTCCHPAIALEAQVALTLRTLCGLSTEEIARACLVPVPTMAQRLVRAKGKIKDAGIAYRVPADELLEERLEAVMAVVYLVFNEGYAATSGDALVRRDLSAEALRLGRLLVELMPEQAQPVALVALMLLHDSRRDARVGPSGDLVLLDEQDRSRWDRASIEEGLTLVEAALRRAPAGRYAIEAAIAALHARAPRAEDTDWPQIAALYSVLAGAHPSPVVALNRAVAIAMAEGPERALPLLDALEGDLADYHLLHAARADLLRRLGRKAQALASYRRARELTTNEAEKRFLDRRIGEVSSP